MDLDKKKFKHILKASYQDENTADKTLSRFGYTLNKKLSTDENKVFIDEQGNPNIVFRGSKVTKDFLVSDPLVAIGLEEYDPRFQKAVTLTDKVFKKYKKPVNLYGSSLGGALAEYAGDKSNNENLIYTYNKATGIDDIFKPIPENQIDVRTNNDVVSLLSKTQNYANPNNKITIQSNTLNPIKAHSINQL